MWVLIAGIALGLIVGAVMFGLLGARRLDFVLGTAGWALMTASFAVVGSGRVQTALVAVAMMGMGALVWSGALWHHRYTGPRNYFSKGGVVGAIIRRRSTVPPAQP